MADEEEKTKPLSLNERTDRLLQAQGLSATPRQPPEPSVRKVKLEGRRRLCKLSSSAAAVPDENPNFDLFDSPSKENGGGGGGDGDLDDLTSMMESLSVQKPKPRPKPATHDLEPEYKSATSSLSPASASSNSGEKEKGKSRLEVKGTSVEPLVLDDDDDDGEEGGEECVVLVSGGKKDDLKDEVWEDDLDGEDDNDVDAITMVGFGSGKSRDYVLPGKTAKMLYPHQREGLKWLWALHCQEGGGGILGDDMGLGKTMQISAFLAGLFYCKLIKRALIVAPKTLIAHWMKELTVVGLSEKIRDYSGSSAKVRQYELQYVLEGGGILLTTYDIVRNNSKSIRGDWYVHGDRCEEEILWDYTILDEGHIIKNPKTQRAQSLHDILSAHRIVISGTPIQNNLKELWALFNFCCPDILGGKDEFKVKYEKPILRGNDKHASDRERYVGSTVAKELRERIKPYFLRRLKSEVFLEGDTKSAKLSKKNEIIVWLKLTSCQRQLYEAFLNSGWVDSAIDGSPLAALTILKKICDHPLLLTKKAAEGILEGMDSMLNREELNMVERMAMNLANLTDQDDIPQVDHNVSCKICFIMSLLENLVGEGHTVLIFSQTRKMLNLIQEEIISAGYKFFRIDGTTKVSERERIVKDFQEGSGAPIFLLTSQVGGLGLTLTKADRVIVVDPAWNPSMDNQSVDRAYRIGQNRNVLVYRLMTCGTIEEKIYKMQVFKGGLFRTATEQKEQIRYFSQRDIRELFSLPKQGFDISLTQQQLHEEHDHQLKMDDSLEKHIEFLQRQDIAGVSHHSLLFSKAAAAPVVHENDEMQCRMENKIVRSSTSSSSIEHAVNGADYAFKPKDVMLTSRANYMKGSMQARDDAEDIEERIHRLSQTLANKGLVSKLPDRGEKVEKQISELKTQLHKIRHSTLNQASEKKEQEVVDVDALTDDLHRVLAV